MPKSKQGRSKFTLGQRIIMAGGRAVPALRYTDRGPPDAFPFVGHRTVREMDEVRAGGSLPDVEAE